MKTIVKVFSLTLFIMGLFGCTQKRPAVIERPVFDVWNSTTLEIDKIEMSDSATVFYIDAYFKPNSWFSISSETYIRKSGTDEKLLVTHSEGIELYESIIMPESGTISFKLFFPPLKRGITKIDFIEKNYKIWGIHLLPNAKIKFDRIPKDVAKTSNKLLPTPEYSIQPAKISGRMLGNTKDMEHSNITIKLFNGLQVKSVETSLSIAEDGSFSGEITPGFPGIYQSSAGTLFLTPGKETKLYIDLKKRSRYESRYRTDKEPGDSIFTYISGNFTSAELETINNISRITKALPDLPSDIQKLYQEVVNMNPEEFKQYILSFLNKRLDEIKQIGYSANMQMMMENVVKMESYAFMMQYEGLIGNAYFAVNNITSREERIKIWENIKSNMEKPNAEYYSFLKEALNDNVSYLPNFLSLVELLSIDYNDFFYIPDWKNKSGKERLDYFMDKTAPIFGTEKGILLDMVYALSYGWKLHEMKYFTDTEKQELRDLFSDKPVYAETLIAESERLEVLITATNENNESIMNELPDVSQEKMLDAILAKYKNKVIVVDIWGTWCGPCITAMKSIQPLKDEMKEKDVVWVYIADGTSPLDAWKQTCPAISGEHYYVSSAQTQYWGIKGYPTYMIYDRQGKQLSNYVGFPGIDVMKKTIEKGL